MSIASEITALQNDKTAIANAITAKGGTVASGDGFQDFATDIGTIPSGITPTGTKSITSNGTHDVTNYASANVNVSSVAVNCKRFTVTVPENKTVNYIIIAGDSDVAQHYADDSAFCLITPASPIQLPSGSSYVVGGFSRNLAVKTSTNAQMGCVTFKASSSGSDYSVGSFSLLKSPTSWSGKVTAYSTGNITIFCTSSAPLFAGTYDIIFGW